MEGLDKILHEHRIAVAYIEKYGGSGHSDKSGMDAYEEADAVAKQALTEWRDSGIAAAYARGRNTQIADNVELYGKIAKLEAELKSKGGSGNE